MKNLLSSEYQHKTKRDELLGVLRNEVDAVEKQVGSTLDKRYATTLEAVKSAGVLLSARR